jgi:hypothetical protein
MDPKATEPTVEQLKALAEAAWEVRESAYTFGHTKVGAAHYPPMARFSSVAMSSIAFVVMMYTLKSMRSPP